MKNQGQAMVETIAFFMALTLMVICFLGFNKWFLVKQKLLIAVRQGVMQYSSGRMTEAEVRQRLMTFLTSGSPSLARNRLQIQIGHEVGFQALTKQLDIVKIRYTSESRWYRFTNLNPTLEEKCIIKHAAPYGLAWQPIYGPPISWWEGSVVSD